MIIYEWSCVFLLIWHSHSLKNVKRNCFFLIFLCLITYFPWKTNSFSFFSLFLSTSSIVYSTEEPFFDANWDFAWAEEQFMKRRDLRRCGKGKIEHNCSKKFSNYKIAVERVLYEKNFFSYSKNVLTIFKILKSSSNVRHVGKNNSGHLKIYCETSMEYWKLKQCWFLKIWFVEKSNFDLYFHVHVSFWITEV